MSELLPDAVEISASKLRVGLVAGVSLAAAVGIAVAAVYSQVHLLWIVAAGDAVLGGIFVVALMRGMGLSLDRDGFTKHGLFGEHRYNWADVSEFRMGRMGKARVIRFDDVTKAGVLSEVRSASGRGNSRISPIVVSGRLQHACDLLNKFRDRAVKR